MKLQLNLFKVLLLLLAIALLPGLVACRPQEEDLSYQTINEGAGFATGRGYDGKEPNLLILAEPEEVDNPGLGVQFTPELANQLRAQDYQHRFAVVALRGLLSGLSPKFTIAILQIKRAGDEVTVKVHLGAPAPGGSVYDAFSSPYHAIAVSKEGLWGKQIRFVLKVDDKPVAETLHFIP